MTVETTEAPVEKKTRVKRSPAELKAARVAKAEKALKRTEDSGTKVVERAKELREKADAAQAKADAHAEALAQARATLAWEQARPIPREVLTGETENPFEDSVDDFEDDDEDGTDADPDLDDDDL
jgi:hypothetical protein